MNTKPVLLLLLFSGLSSCKAQELQTVPKVDLQKYIGKWYDISHLPASFMKGCECTTAEYSVSGKGYINVLNSCVKKGKWNKARGKAYVVPGSNNSKLKVSFFWPFKGDYWIIELADDYSYAVVGEKTRKYLWILSRTPQMNEKDLLKNK
jgi:apolipoprotein D and lipocalin family protein